MHPRNVVTKMLLLCNTLEYTIPNPLWAWACRGLRDKACSNYSEARSYFWLFRNAVPYAINASGFYLIDPVWDMLHHYSRWRTFKTLKQILQINSFHSKSHLNWFLPFHTLDQSVGPSWRDLTILGSSSSWNISHPYCCTPWRSLDPRAEVHQKPTMPHPDAYNLSMRYPCYWWDQCW